MTANTRISAGSAAVDCDVNSTKSLVDMFVNMVQKDRIDAGQCPASRSVFLKPHGIAKGTFKIKPGLPKNLAIGLFSGTEYPLWARFSSDTLPTSNDYKTTCGIGLKLFNTPTPKIFGLPNEITFDFIMQNFPVFFVDTAKDMCEFTKAGVIDGDYASYLDKHPKTQKILEDMAQPVGSVLSIPYWGILPFSLGKDQYVKYLLKPTVEDRPLLVEAPVDPTYLAQEMASRLSSKAVSFDFCVQLRTNPDTMPLDEATIEWPSSESPFIPIAEVHFSQQDINSRGQAAFGENLSMNIWRVTEEHQPQGSIADVRRDVYAASASQRCNANGVPDGEPATNRPAEQLPPCKDEVIVRAAIHPGIGVARVGNAENEFYIGPEVSQPPVAPEGFYRTSEGMLKREAARFRIYGYNAAGEVVRELTSDNADINWTAHVANRKADWFHFITAMDIPETKNLTVTPRNPDIKGKYRASLVIDPGPRSIGGSSRSGNKYRFDSGEFKGCKVYLGELQTDEKGRLLFLGGHGKSVSPSSKPPFIPEDPDSFNNAPDWYDDMSDGPVTASVKINGQSIQVEGAWVICAPPNYAPDIIGWRTMYDLMVDVYTQNGWLPVPETTSFTKDVLPQLSRLCNLQWVNKGFATMFGKGQPMDFRNPEFIAKLAQKPNSINEDAYGELRQQLLNSFRPYRPKINDPRLWPWLYGDDFGSDLFQDSPNTMLALPSLQQLHLQRWAKGNFENDWQPDYHPPKALADVPVSEQPATLDEASMHFCLADAFHPGCEMTWPMRHASMYQAPFRIRSSEVPETPNQWGSSLDQREVLAPDGPLYAQVPGSITRWMGLPWQGDTAYCRSGYDTSYDLFLPSFWPARVPNTVLTEKDYQIVIDNNRPRVERVAAYNRRADWDRFIDHLGNKDIPKVMEIMISDFAKQGIVEARPGVKDDPDFPELIYVESNAYVKQSSHLVEALVDADTEASDMHFQQSSWSDNEDYRQDVIRLRQRKPINRQ